MMFLLYLKYFLKKVKKEEKFYKKKVFLFYLHLTTFVPTNQELLISNKSLIIFLVYSLYLILVLILIHLIAFIDVF